MDPKSKEVLEQIISKEVDALQETEIAFLNTRASYLSDEMKEKFSSVLAGEETSAKKKTKKSE